MAVQRPRGTSDILSGQSVLWQKLESTARQVFSDYHFHEIRTPIFEHTEVFERGVGETTDIVEKEMYTFLDKGDRSITLRPEGTAGVIRAYVENKLYGLPGAVKLYYIGPMFRYEKPQKGRERQFHQYGCEVLGAEGPDIDAEVILLNLDTLKRFGLSGLLVELNSVGCSECRPIHKQRMVEAIVPVRERLCKDCNHRLERNPLRIFDCKNGCRQLLEEVSAPTILEALCSGCQKHFDALLALLNDLEVPFTVNPQLVRGLDYYTRTAWEITAAGAGTVGGGGRYNGLVQQLGGPDMPGIGFAVGMERAILLHQEQSGSEPDAHDLDVFVIVADATGAMAAQKLLQQFRSSGLSADKDYQGKGMKAQFKAADREGARFAVIIGQAEMEKGIGTVKNLQTTEQVEVGIAEVVSYVQEQLNRR